MAMAQLPNPDSFKPNSNKYREQQRKKKDIHKVTTGAVKIKKESLGKRVAKGFFAEDIDSVLEYLISDNLIPQLKRVFLDGLYEGIGLWLGIGGRKKKNSNGGTDYASVSSGSYRYGSSTGGSRNSGSISNSNGSANYNNLIFESRNDANDALSSLQELAAEYGSVSISDLYQVVGVSQGQWTDVKFGWNLDLLRTVNIKMTTEGYTLIFPDPISIE